MKLPHNREDEQIQPLYIEDELKKSYLTYAMSVNTNRAIPDVRDGLKPSTRRIIYAMGEINLTSNRPYDKCAAVVGEVMKDYHPHGDGPIYSTLVGLVQEFGMRYPIVDGQGNFGSIDDDPAGAMRYTECRLTKIADEMLADVHRGAVEFQPNYKESTTEPTVLPARLPNLILNGTTGIGVGYLTRIPPHNLNEVVDGILLLLEKPEASVDELMEFIPGPDFPTAGIIVGRAGIRDVYSTGRGSIPVRARAVIERRQDGREQIVITEMPFQVKKNQLLMKMYDLVSSKTITGISDIRDESDSNIRVVIDLKRGEIAQVILNQLFKHTQMQSNFSAIMLCLVEGVPKALNLPQILAYYIEHRREVVQGRTQFDLSKSENRSHVLEGYRTALNNIEEIIEIVQTADSPDSAKNLLIVNYELSEVQASEILTMTLRQLTGLERQKINDEYTDLIALIAELKAVLDSELLVTDIIRQELLELKEKYGDERRTEIAGAVKDFDIEDLIADEEMVVVVSHSGYIKRIPSDTYRQQHRGGKGVIGMGTKDDDYIEHIFVASAHQYILFFTDYGKCYWLKVFEIPEGGRTARGRAIVNLLRIEGDEQVTTFVPIREFDPEKFVFMATENGTVKKCSLEVFSRPYSAGIIAINLVGEDRLVGVELMEKDYHIVLVTKKGMSIRFSEGDVRSVGRPAQGVRGIRLAEDDKVVGMVTAAEENSTVLVVTENGYGKRTLLDAYRRQSRGGKGVITVKTSKRNGDVVSVKMVKDGDELVLISSSGMVTRMGVSALRKIGRNTQGVRIMSLNVDEVVVDVGQILAENEDE
ncbi:MAG: DNA gyrase subunit A [Candidatus Poribacteria bacterium]|nr:DNA gyrase subunit A [Candidatus Poribacteria bacterium]